MKATFFRRRFAVILSIVAASLVLAGTATLATLNLRHVHASGTGLNSCNPSAGSSTCHFSGFTTYGEFTMGWDSCTYATESIFIADNVTHDEPSAPTGQPFVSVSIFKADICTGYTPLEDAWGTTTSAVIRHDASLGSAAVTATVPVTDYYTGVTSNITVDLTWKGFGSINSVMDSHASHSGHVLYRTHYTGDSRTAMVSGTFSEGSMNYATTPALCIMSETRGGTLDIIHQ